MMYWENPTVLLALWILPFVAGLLVYAHRKRTAASRRFADPAMAGRLLPPAPGWRPWVKGGLLLAGLAALIVAGAGPRFGVHVEKIAQRGVDLVVLLDVSKSMTAEDVPPNRLERAKRDIHDLMTRLVGDRIGLVVFAGKPVLKVPLTTDYGFFRMVLDEVGPDSAPRGGTLIGDGIRKCLEALPPRRDRDQVIVLITDGEDQESYPVEAARQAAARGIKIFTVGLGDSREGARIPLRDKNAQVHYLKSDGQEHWSKLDESLLQEIALTAGGAYIPAGTRIYDLGQIYADHLAKLTRGQIHAEKRKRYRLQCRWFICLGLGFLLAEMLIPAYPRPNPRAAPGDVGRTDDLGDWSRLVPLAVLLTLAAPATPALAGPGAGEKVREGIVHYQQGNYRKALSAFNEAGAARPDDLRITFDRACAYAASGEVDKAVELFQRAALSHEPEIAAGSRYNLGNLAVAKARTLFGKNAAEASPQAREEGRAILHRAVAHYRDCLELDPQHADARYNLELVRLWIKHMEALWQQRDREEKRDQTNLLEFLAMLESRQRELREDARPWAGAPDSPKRRQALAALESSQRALAEEIEPLKEKLAEVCRQSEPPAAGATAPTQPAVDQEALERLTGLADQTHDAMHAAADRLHDSQPAEALQGQARAIESLDQLYLAVAPFTELLQRALAKQQELVDQVEEAADHETPPEGFDFGESAWEQDFVAGWNEALPAKAEQELKQMEAAAEDPSRQPPQSKEAKAHGECLKRAFQKAIELGPEKLHAPAAEAAARLEAKEPAEALPRQQEALERLQEIADELPPPDNRPKDSPQAKKKDKKQDQQRNEQKQPQAGTKPKPSKKDLSKQQAEIVLRKVRQRQRYRRDMQRYLQKFIVRPEQVEKDW